ncbi:hypothetical protein Ahy_B06g084436 [Arachis hypogaea]|uniref:Uncharacterized protein n=1 Tax=Arachis hypogaea TaxID=3818 RepID=A0A444YRW6_ARAHY|nr:hypothetical protein Ahy_B06g084436 [Arachis hypogaea]
MDATTPESSHGSEAAADALPPPSIVQFLPNPNACTQEMTNVIKLMYDQPCPSYTKIPAETRQRWFEKWALHFIWDAGHDLAIRKIFDYRMGRRLQQMLDDVHHDRDKRKHWLRAEVKKDLFAHWENNAGFKHQRLTNRANRALERSLKYTGGSATFLKTKAWLICSSFNISKSLDHEATLAETFKYTHTLKENKMRFVD